MRGIYVAFFISDIPPDKYYLDHTQPLDLAGKAVYAAATVVADGLLVSSLQIRFATAT
jgi:hypothetical protein